MTNPPSPQPLPQTFEPERLVALLESHVGTLVDGRAALVALLGTAHRLSLYVDEGRHLVGGMLLAEGGAPPPLATWWVRGAHRADFEGLKPLLPIAAGRSACLWLSWGLSPGGAGSTVSAIAPWPTHPRTPAPPGPFLVEILAPGCLSLSSGIHEVRFERDKCYSVAGDADLGSLFTPGDAAALAGLFTPSHTTMSTTELRSGHFIDEQKRCDNADRITQVAASVALPLLGRGALEILRAVKRQGHGGIVLVERDVVTLGVTGDDGSADPLHGSLFAGELSFRRMPDSSPRHRLRGLVDLLGWWIMDECFRQHSIRLSWSTFGRECPTDDAWHRNVVLERLDSATQKMRSDAQRIASLSQVDGILVLDATLDVVMTGAKFTPPEGTSMPEAFANAVKGHGARHRAGAALAARLPRTICFVISQDGGVIAFQHDGSTPKTQRLKV